MRVAGITVVLFLSWAAFAADGGPRHARFSGLLERHVQDGLVDYEAFGSDPDFPLYLTYLASVSPDTFSLRDDQLAFWINAYNAYTIKLIVDRMPLSSIRDISLGLPVLFGPWSISMANVGGVEYTLNEIEHDIIRDRFEDARIHCALVCASMSCPKLRTEAYEGGTLHSQLEDDATRFVNDSRLNLFDPEGNTATLSRIFDWYEGDFERYAGSVRLFLSRYLASPEARALLWEEGVEYEYFPYDWSLNGQ